MRFPFLLFAALLTPAPSPATDPVALEKSFDQQVKPFLKQYCTRCHNVDKMTSGVRVDHLDAKLEDRQLKLWEHIPNQVRTRTMPPEDAKQPTADERKLAVAWIEGAMKVALSRP